MGDPDRHMMSGGDRGSYRILIDQSPNLFQSRPLTSDLLMHGIESHPSCASICSFVSLRAMIEKVDAGYSRLHISPLDPQLLRVILPPAVLPNARRVSYHNLQTFPDRPYGFVDLPTADAAKIKTKLNGATLRAAKIVIEPARAEVVPTPLPDAIMAIDSALQARKSKSDKNRKKRKCDNLETSGVELEDGRKVKRGWTVTAEAAQAKKKKAKDEDRKHGNSKTKEAEKRQKRRRRQEPVSQYFDGPEALVKIRLPPNKVASLHSNTEGDKKKSKKSKSKGRTVLVHEFENNTKFATFLKTTQSTPATGREEPSYVKGKGWVDNDGNILQEVKSTRPTTVPKLQASTMASHLKATDHNDTSSSSGSLSEESDSEVESLQASPIARQPHRKPDMPPPSLDTKLASSVPEVDSARPKSASSMRSLTIQIPPATPTPTSSKVHPLEALYKRPLLNKADGSSTHQAPVDYPPFTFGGGDNDDLEDEGQAGHINENEDSQDHFQVSQVPMTPYSKQDFDWRTIRSAAPTPDTAHPSRISRLWPLGTDDDLADVQEDEQEGEEHSPVEHKDAARGENADEEAIDPNTDFQKWFWKNRGDLDRSWRRRRREAAKAKRYRANKAKAHRAV